MANPNLLNLVNITAKTNYSNVTTVNTSIVSNSINSNLVYKLNHITVVNNSDSPNYFTVRINRNSNIFVIASNMVLPDRTTLILINKENATYLEEGDSVEISAGANNTIVAYSSYEILA